MGRKGGEILVKARAALNELWKRCRVTGFVGRCYARGRDCTSRIRGSNIVLCDGDEIVIIYQEDEIGPIQIETFKRVRVSGTLGSEVRQVLKTCKLYP